MTARDIDQVTIKSHSEPDFAIRKYGNLWITARENKSEVLALIILIWQCFNYKGIITVCLICVEYFKFQTNIHILFLFFRNILLCPGHVFVLPFPASKCQNICWTAWEVSPSQWECICQDTRWTFLEHVPYQTATDQKFPNYYDATWECRKYWTQVQ